MLLFPGWVRFEIETNLVSAELADGRALAASAEALSRGADPESERLFNGRLIAVLRTLSTALGIRPTDRAGQCDTLVMAAALTGLALFSRTGRLAALGFSSEELIKRLAARLAPAEGVLDREAIRDEP